MTPIDAGIAILAGQIAQIAESQDYTARTQTAEQAPLAGIAAAVNALLDSVCARSVKLREEADQMRSAWDDAQTANMLLRRMKDELKARSQQLDQAVIKAAAASAAKSQFLANMSHEIRTPMNGILGTAELLARTQLAEKQKNYVGTIIRSGRALLTVINDVLDFSKIESGKLELDKRPFDLLQCVTDVAALLSPSCAKKQIGLVVDIEPGLPSSYVGDVGRIRQLLTNIAGNAIKFTDAGEVRIVLKGKVVDAHAELLLEVIDTGIGIPPERMQDIFEEFSQVDNTSSRIYEGTGLGLAITKSLIERMGGRIGLTSTVGVGSTFWINLPLEVHQAVIVAAPVGVEVSGQSIMIFEELTGTGAGLGAQFERLGCAVTIVSDDAAAVSVLSSPASSVPAFIVLYGQSADGALLGKVACLRATTGAAQVPIAVIAASGSTGDSKRFGDAGVQAYLTGDLTDGQLENAVRVILANAAAGLPSLVTRFTLDAGNPTLQAESGASAKATGSGRNKVLLADDSLVNREVARDFLESMGCTVEMAKNGREAVTALDHGEFDVVLLDCQMPIMDGFQATRAIREKETNARLRRIPIIALTANAFEADREKCMAAGMTDFISKPFMPDHFEATIRKWLAAA